MERAKGPVIEKLRSDRASRSVGVPSVDITKIASTIGTQEFISSMLQFGKSRINADFVAIVCLDDKEVPYLIGTKCTVGRNRANVAAKGYAKHYEEDIDYQMMKSASPNGDFTTYQTRNDIVSLTYRSDCYDKPKIADRRSAIRKRERYALKLSFYRSMETGEFDDSDRILLDGLLPMLFALTERHVAFYLKGKIATSENNKSQLALSYPSLTKRELEVVSLTLKGMTASDIASHLGVAESTIISHRKNAYQRLGVSNMKELMRL